MPDFPKRPRSSILFLICSVLIFCACERLQGDAANEAAQHPAPQARTEPDLSASGPLAFGNPSGANINDPDNYLIVDESSVISYNNSRGTPNWVAWKTTRDDLGPAIPRPDFQPDPRLPRTFRAITTFDYSGSGYDRGHLLPSADRFADAKLNERTFYLTNIVPQTPALNRYPWERLESYVRTQARRGMDLHQISGVYGRQRIIREKLVAPTNCWKIIAVVPRGRRIEDMDPRMRIIAVDMPNITGIENDDWKRYSVTIHEIEQRTGLDFFNHLPSSLSDRLKRRFEMENR
ncbi:MAG TPA: DNA/RNA non-specific endonuclease [Pyrinomonadaceae bacterium]|mgnify:CR=1 FL=1|nr:DNA/RNA non-specific endonuclease [Pyrinomonadaceae bacterium]HMP65378.1 DNA/RNA non-specific endonuclease [Pyrinomonadaceae bacterium]